MSATLGVGGAAIVLAIISTALRFYTRVISKAGIGLDDWMILLSTVSLIVTAVLLVLGSIMDPSGNEVSQETDPDFQYSESNLTYLKLTFAAAVLYFTISASTKSGILIMYHRLFAVSRNFRRQLLLVHLLVGGWWVGCTIAAIFNCVPIRYSWIKGPTPDGYCFNFNIFWMASGACEVLLDVIVLALPVRFVLSLQLSGKKKIAVACVFLLGGFVIITGLLKVVFGYVPGAMVPDYSRTEVWTTVHIGIGIVCACLPIFKPLVVRISNSKFASKIASRLHGGRFYDPITKNSAIGSESSDSEGRHSEAVELRRHQKINSDVVMERVPLNRSMS